MKNLYLATFTKRITPYMGDTRYEDGTRLVWANSVEEVREQLDAAYEDFSHGGGSVWLEGVEITQALGSPE